MLSVELVLTTWNPIWPEEFGVSSYPRKLSPLSSFERSIVELVASEDLNHIDKENGSVRSKSMTASSAMLTYSLTPSRVIECWVQFPPATSVVKSASSMLVGVPTFMFPDRSGMTSAAAWTEWTLPSLNTAFASAAVRALFQTATSSM